MRRGAQHFLLALTAMVLATGPVGCVATPPSRAEQGLVWGFVSSAKHAQLVVDEQNSSALAVRLSKVVAPEPVWVCVYEDNGGVVGTMVGQVRLERGTTQNVEIPLDPLKSNQVYVLMHADRGKLNVFEFDEQNKDDSPDRPIFVDGTELVKTVTLRPYGVKAAPGTAKVDVYRQGSLGTTVTVGTVVAPANSWLVAQAKESGRPGRVIGFLAVAPGSLTDVPLALTSGAPTQSFYVTLFADSGVAGRFEFDPASPLSSADQPYYVDGVPVRSEVPVKK